MGIYIKDLELPKDGFIELLISSDGMVRQTGYAECKLSDEMNSILGYSGRFVVNIPAPHGELIDRDSLLQEVHKRLLLCNKYENNFQKPYEIIRAIETASVIIPKEGDAE